MGNGEKLAVLFPGTGYHTDKPLLYYSKKLAQSYGYDIVALSYKGLRKGMSKQEVCQSAWRQTKEQLSKVDFSWRSDILFISKSMGTVMAAAYMKEKNLSTDNIVFTPVKECFSFLGASYLTGIAFHGTRDPMLDSETAKRECEARYLKLYEIKDGNHSLETGDVRTDIDNLSEIIEKCDDYLRMLEIDSRYRYEPEESMLPLYGCPAAEEVKGIVPECMLAVFDGFEEETYEE